MDVVKQARRTCANASGSSSAESGAVLAALGVDNLRYFASLYGVDPDVSSAFLTCLSYWIEGQGR
jgi:hypothetical protein